MINNSGGFLQKITLGTVQFGIPYGINNKNGVLKLDEISKILDFANNVGINLIDTASGYGDAEKKIGNLSNRRFKVITKLPARLSGQKYTSKWLRDSIHDSMTKLKTNKIDALLLHKPSDLLDLDGELFFLDLQNLKIEGLIEKIGISIYDTSELDLLLKYFSFDLVQAPFNVLDRRLLESGWLDRLYNLGIDIHVRSIFLQGLLLMDSQKRPSKFDKWKVLLEDYDNWLKESNLGALEACLNFVLSFKEITNVIVGIDNLEHLKKIVLVSKDCIKTPPSNLSSSDKLLLNPLNWLNL